MSLTRRRLFEQLAGRAASAGPVLRISLNENPVGPGQRVLDALSGRLHEASRYPFNARQPHDGELPAAIAATFPGAKAENVVMGAGSGEILTNAVRAFTSPQRPLAMAWPSFENPNVTARKIGTPVREVKLDASLRLDAPAIAAAARGAGLVFFCNPNNPTATVHGHAAVADFVKQVRAASSDTVIVIDEAYHDYVTDPAYQTAVDIALATPNVIVTRTFSKAYGMAGLRIGYAIGHPPIIRRLEAFRLPLGIGTLQIAGLFGALNNPAHIAAERARNREVRTFTQKSFADMGFSSTDAQSNFIFVNIKRPAAPFRDACAAQGVLVGRDFPPYDKTHCRISIGTMAEMQRAVGVFRTVLGAPPTTAREKG